MFLWEFTLELDKNKIFKDMLLAGYNVKGIGIRSGEISGEKIYTNFNELEYIPDLVITVVPPKATEKIVEKCKELNIKEIWMQPGSESDNAIKKAKEYGINVIANACFMIQSGTWRR